MARQAFMASRCIIAARATRISCRFVRSLSNLSSGSKSGWTRASKRRIRERVECAVRSAALRITCISGRGLSRSGAVLSAGLGVLASVPLVGRVLFPGLTARLRKRVGGFVAPPRKTRLQLERTDEKPGPTSGGVGFTPDEMARIGEQRYFATSVSSAASRRSWCFSATAREA